MSRAELIENLGTIARSGTQRFLDELATARGRAEGAGLSLIGQFGVGFYAAFMVADKVEVRSRKAGEQEAWRWESDGRNGFAIEPADGPARGTEVVLHLKADERGYLEPERLRRIVKTYSDHVAFPIRLVSPVGAPPETVNSASALWSRPRNEVTPEQYREFYHHVAHALDDPWLTLHFRAEGKIEYAALLFVPGQRPFDLFEPERKPRLRLYVKRVFITEDCDALIPRYLRFLRGVVDSSDLPLNVSRETLQDNPLVHKIRAGLTGRVLGELDKKAEKEPEGYRAFWENFGAVLKEGLYEDPGQRPTLLKLARFASSRESRSLTTLADYVARMRPGQSSIYYLAGDEARNFAASPQLEGFVDRGLEVLFLSDPVDEFWVAALGEFEGKPFRSITRGAADISRFAPEGKAGGGEKEGAAADLGGLIALMRLALGDAVKEVRASERLTESPVCLVADDADLDIHLERLLRQHRRVSEAAKRILELNPRHPLIRALSEAAGREANNEALSEAAWLLFDQARLLDGESPADTGAFAKRLSAVMARALRASGG
jgi:molecular chaperone HtpG